MKRILFLLIIILLILIVCVEILGFYIIFTSDDDFVEMYITEFKISEKGSFHFIAGLVLMIAFYFSILGAFQCLIFGGVWGWRCGFIPCKKNRIIEALENLLSLIKLWIFYMLIVGFIEGIQVIISNGIYTN